MTYTKYSTVFLIAVVVSGLLAVTGVKFRKKEEQSKVDVYEKQVELLEKQIVKNKVFLDSLTRENDTLQVKLKQTVNSLTQLSKRTEKLKQKLNEEINYINSLSTDSIVAVFTTTFDYD